MSRQPRSWSRRLPWEIAWRLLVGRHRSLLLDSTARAALLATAVGVAAMVVAMALMTGYRGDLARKLIGGNAAIVAYPGESLGEDAVAEMIETIRGVPEVTRVDRVAYGQGVLTGVNGAEREITLRGVEGSGSGLLVAGAEALAERDGVPGAVLGIDLAVALGVGPGDRLRLVALGLRESRPRFAFATVRLGGTFDSGFSEFDRSWVVVERSVLERLSGRGLVSLEIAVVDPARAPAVAAVARERLRGDLLVTDWQELNRELFTALRIQQLALFLLLGLIVLVSTFNVASSLVVLVRERRRDLGVLAALGLPPPALRRIFLVFGSLLGGLGAVGGAGVGALVAWTLTRFELIRFEPGVAEIYFLRSVPFRVEIGDVATVVAFACVVTLASCWFPARKAALVEPASALRYE